MKKTGLRLEDATSQNAQNWYTGVRLLKFSFLSLWRPSPGYSGSTPTLIPALSQALPIFLTSEALGLSPEPGSP